jgi:PleD family two-component response regulator
MKNSEIKIIIVDNDTQDRESACQILRREGYCVDGIASAEQALKAIEASLPSLVITKMSTRDIEGLVLVTRIRKHVGALMLPIMMYTPITRQAQVEALRVGVNDFLTKPLHEIELIARTRSLLAARDAYSEIADLKRKLGSRIADAIAAKPHRLDSQSAVQTAQGPGQ